MSLWFHIFYSWVVPGYWNIVPVVGLEVDPDRTRYAEAVDHILAVDRIAGVDRIEAAADIAVGLVGAGVEVGRRAADHRHHRGGLVVDKVAELAGLGLLLVVLPVGVDHTQLAGSVAGPEPRAGIAVAGRVPEQLGLEVGGLGPGR